MKRKESYYETFKSIRFPTQIYSPNYYGIRPYSIFLTIQENTHLVYYDWEISGPLFLFAVIEGFVHTHNRKNTS